MKFKELLNKKESNFYILLTLILIAILFTNPFLRYPYDMIHHLIHIDRYYDSTDIPSGRWIWHFLWAKFFYLFNIQYSEIFFRAKIIHLIQTYIAFFSIYFFSKVMIRNLFKEIDIVVLKYLSLWSVIIWFSIFATFSMYYQLVWNLWYSVNYQITLPLFWYITALSLILLFEETTLKKKIFFLLQILLVSLFILLTHSMEFMYYLMYMCIFLIIYIDKVYYFIKRYFYLYILGIIAIIYFTIQYQPKNSRIFNYFSFDKLPILYDKIMAEGQLLVAGLNRASASINELIYLIYYLTIIMILIVIRNKLKNEVQFIDFRKFIFIIITSMFVLIPLFEFSGGLFGIITKTAVVNRIYYSSSLFVIIPVFVYYIFNIFYGNKTKVILINISIILILSSVWLYSKYNIEGSGNYYKNVKSIKNSFFERRVGFNLSKEQIDIIGEKLKYYESINKSGKDEFYHARADISFVIKYIYRKSVYWRDRRANLDYIKWYNKRKKIYKNHKQYHWVLFKVPKGFPDYEPYK